VKKGQNGRKSLRRLKPIVGCNASKRRRRILYYLTITSMPMAGLWADIQTWNLLEHKAVLISTWT